MDLGSGLGKEEYSAGKGYVEAAKFMEPRTTYSLLAFVLGWTRNWPKDAWLLGSNKVLVNSFYDDPFQSVVVRETQGRVREQFNRSLAELFGEVVTKVKCFPTDGNGSWIILDKSTKRMLHRDIKNENEVNILCRAKGYLR